MAHPVQGDNLREPVWIAIRTVLMESWDPIGVCNWPENADEYDSYIPKIKAMLRAGCSVEDLMDYLDWVESEPMGFTSQRERGRQAAERLMPLRSMLWPLDVERTSQWIG